MYGGADRGLAPLPHPIILTNSRNPCFMPTYAPRQDFGEHGREFISSELGLLLMRTLADKEAITHLWGDSAEDVRRGQALQRLLEGTVMKVGVGEDVRVCEDTGGVEGAT